MNLKAFLQAALIVLLLSISWVFLVHRIQKEPTPATPEDNSLPMETEPVLPSSDEVTSADDTARTSDHDNRDIVTGNWLEWWDYLDSRESPMDMRIALGQLRSLIREMDPESAIGWLLEFIRSGADMRTGLAFQLQGDGRLRGTASLRAYLLDLLQMLDPVLAGELAQQELNDAGTDLVPDVYVVHLRNYARNPAISKAEAIPFLQEKFGDLIHHEPWMANPTTALAEAMDVAVYAKATQFVPDLEILMNKDQSQMLRHASSLALERLVDTSPLETLSSFLDTATDNPDIAIARAGYFARLDPGIPGASDLLDQYLGSRFLKQEEAVRFLESFPNLNQSLSYNLLSTDISNTVPGSHVERIRNAITQIDEWQNDDKLGNLEEILAETRARLQLQLTGEPVP